MRRKKIKKILLVCSSGGHLLQLARLSRSLDCDSSFIWVTFNKPDANSILKNEKKYWGYFPTNRNIYNLLRNFFLALHIFLIERPTNVISTGAGIAIPFVLLGRIFCKNAIYIESFARSENLSLTGKLLYPIVKHFFVQSEELALRYKKAEFRGAIY